MTVRRVIEAESVPCTACNFHADGTRRCTFCSCHYCGIVNDFDDNPLPSTTSAATSSSSSLLPLQLFVCGQCTRKWHRECTGEKNRIEKEEEEWCPFCPHSGLPATTNVIPNLQNDVSIPPQRSVTMFAPIPEPEAEGLLHPPRHGMDEVESARINPRSSVTPPPSASFFSQLFRSSPTTLMHASSAWQCITAGTSVGDRKNIAPLSALPPWVDDFLVRHQKFMRDVRSAQRRTIDREEEGEEASRKKLRKSNTRDSSSRGGAKGNPVPKPNGYEDDQPDDYDSVRKASASTNRAVMLQLGLPVRGAEVVIRNSRSSKQRTKPSTQHDPAVGEDGSENGKLSSKSVHVEDVDKEEEEEDDANSAFLSERAQRVAENKQRLQRLEAAQSGTPSSPPPPPSPSRSRSRGGAPVVVSSIRTRSQLQQEERQQAPPTNTLVT